MSQAPVQPRSVLHVMASGARGGGADHLLGLLPALAAQGMQVRAAVGDDGPLAEALTARGIHTQTLSVMGRRTSPRAVWALGQLCRQKVDVVHLHGTRAAFFAGLAQKIGAFGVPPPRAVRVYSAHGLAFRQAAKNPMRGVRLWAERIACQHVQAVVSVSRGDLAELVTYGFVQERLSAHIPNAVDTKRFAPGSKRDARRRLGLADNLALVGTTSRLVPQKAVGDLMDAVVQLPQTHLLVIGEGPLRPALEAHPLVREGRAYLLGARDDVAQILPAVDVFALSSHWEGEPIALLEALATALGCVASATFGAQEILQGGALGQLVPIADVRAMAAALRALLADRARCEAYGQAGRAAMEQRSYAAQAARMRALYMELLTR